MEFVQIKHRVRENEVLSGGVSAILRSGLILENIQRMFLLSVCLTGTMYMFFYENFLRMFSRIRPWLGCSKRR